MLIAIATCTYGYVFFKPYIYIYMHVYNIISDNMCFSQSSFVEFVKSSFNLISGCSDSL